MDSGEIQMFTGLSLPQSRALLRQRQLNGKRNRLLSALKRSSLDVCR